MDALVRECSQECSTVILAVEEELFKGFSRFKSKVFSLRALGFKIARVGKVGSFGGWISRNWSGK